MSGKIPVTLKLPQLQNLIKRDPAAYRDEFELQYNRFQSELEIFKLRPTNDSERFTDLMTFMSHVVHCYGKESSDVPQSLLSLMEENAATLHPEVRAKLMTSLILLRNKGIIDPLVLLKLSFKLMATPDKALRLSLGEYIFNDIKAINLNKHNEKLNRRVQALLFSIVEEDTSIVARKTVEILSELYRRRVWTDARTVNVLGTACISPATRVAIVAINFFLGIETQMHEDDEEEKSAVAGSKADVNYHEHSKKTRARQRHVKKQVEHNSKVRRDQANKASEAIPLFPAIQLLYDPQSMAEKLCQKLKQSGERFEVKLLLMNFVSRLIGCHKLILLNFYSYLQRYLTSHQQEVTRILTYLVQSSHDLIPPEELLPVVRTIANNFITERCTNEAITVGLNAVREVIVRAPALLREDGMGDLIQDLAMYGKKTHKSVMIAAHGIVNLVRELYPALLRKGDRGKFHNLAHIPSNYGDHKAAEGVQGIELLEAFERGEIRIDSDDEVVFGEDEEEEEEEDEEEGEEAPQLVPVDDEGEDEEEEDEEGDEEGDDEDEDEEEVEEDDEDEAEAEAEDEDEDEDGWEFVSDDEGTSTAPAASAAAEVGGKRKRVTFDSQPQEQPQPTRVPAASKDPKNRIDANRILSSEDFSLISRLRTAMAERAKDPRYRTKVKNLAKAASLKGSGDSSGGGEDADGDDEASQGDGLPYMLDDDALGAACRTSKSSKLERMTRVLEGRKETGNFEHNGHGGGTTNLEKLRKKNYVMVRKGKRSVRNKIRTSNSETRWNKMHQTEQYGRDRRKRRRT